MVGLQSLTDHVHPAAAVAFAKRRLDRFAETRPIVFPNDEPVEDNVEGRLTMECRNFGLVEIEGLLPESDFGEPSGQERLDKGRLALSRWRWQGKQEHGSGVGKAFEQVGGDGIGVKCPGLFMTVGADRSANFGK